MKLEELRFMLPFFLLHNISSNIFLILQFTYFSSFIKDLTHSAQERMRSDTRILDLGLSKTSAFMYQKKEKIYSAKYEPSFVADKCCDGSWELF